MKNIIIFGGAGFLGSWIAKNFVKRNYKVTIFDLKIEKNLLKKQKFFRTINYDGL